MSIDQTLVDPTAEVSRRLADELGSITLEAIPSATVERARLVLLDTFGAMLAGSAHSESAAAVRQTILRFADNGTSTIVGHGATVSSPWAALCNGVAAHSLEVDDAHRYATGYHPGATVIPAVLAVAEQEGASILQVLEALIVGYEAGGRIGRAINPSHRYRGFHSTGTVGVFGAAAAAGKVLGFTSHEMLMALGIAGSMAGGVFAFLDGMHPTKLLHAGHAAQAGVLSALLVRDGFTGPAHILEGADGFFSAYSDESRPERVTEDLGSRSEVFATYFKSFAACGHSFSAVEAACELRLAGVRAEDVAELTIDTYRAAAVLAEQHPRSLQQGQFSLPFLAALATCEGEVSVAKMRIGLETQSVMDLAARTSVRESAEMTASFPKLRSTRVTARLRDGSLRTAQVDVPLGMPERPLSREQLLHKFSQLTSPVVGEEASAILKRSILAGTGSVRELTACRLLAHPMVT